MANRSSEKNLVSFGGIFYSLTTSESDVLSTLRQNDIASFLKGKEFTRN